MFTKAQEGKREQTRQFKDMTVKRTLTIKKKAAAKKSYTPVLENTRDHKKSQFLVA